MTKPKRGHPTMQLTCPSCKRAKPFTGTEMRAHIVPCIVRQAKKAEVRNG